MKIYVNSPFHYSEQIRFLARRFPNTPENAFDIVQLGFLNENVTLDLSHGGGNFLPKYPFWFERENYMMSTRILHWIYEKKVIVTGRLRKRINHKSVGFYQAPQEIFYAYGGYYMEMIFVKGFSLDEGFPHRYYVQGDKKLVLPTAWYPRDRFSETRLSTEYFDQNTVEAYRSYLGNPTSFHGDTDQLILESLGPPMPYHATFNFGGFYLGKFLHYY
ncbi:unnamed protein product [Onchocerca ochengi]|uniref:RNA methyltransferase n=1 Tax=Onchocerca ochengi TaxID=42157 RepID=A0A182E3Y0_ONCOC|nr:unnamed protein product [Onchocerca ochengi]